MSSLPVWQIFITVVTFPVSVLSYFVCITIGTPASLLHFQREMSKGGRLPMSDIASSALNSFQLRSLAAIGE